VGLKNKQLLLKKKKRDFAKIVKNRFFILGLTSSKIKPTTHNPQPQNLKIT
jgi:hypothetical protein